MKTLVLNWKMNCDKNKCFQFNDSFKNYDNLIIAPPATMFHYFDKKIKLSSQCVHYEMKGAYTGALSVNHIIEEGVKYSILGHSERRAVNSLESDNLDKSISLCFSQGVTPILCIGESLDVKNKNETKIFLKKQIEDSLLKCLSNIGLNEKSILDNEFFIAYEPIWSIGTGLIPDNDYIYNIFEFIKSNLNDFGFTNYKILYGGSVDKFNIKNLLDISGIDGFLVGSAGFSVDSVQSMLNAINKV